MMALARGAADPAQAARLGRLFGDPDLDEAGAAELRGIIRTTGALAETERMIRARSKRALRALAAAPIPAPVAEAVSSLASAAVHRQG